MDIALLTTVSSIELFRKIHWHDREKERSRLDTQNGIFSRLYKPQTPSRGVPTVPITSVVAEVFCLDAQYDNCCDVGPCCRTSLHPYAGTSDELYSLEHFVRLGSLLQRGNEVDEKLCCTCSSSAVKKRVRRIRSYEVFLSCSINALTKFRNRFSLLFPSFSAGRTDSR
jgi:hypothetical protein